MTSIGSPETSGVGSSRGPGTTSDHVAAEIPRSKLHSSFMLANSKSNQPTSGIGDAFGGGGGGGVSGGVGGIKASLSQSMSGTVGVTGLLQLPNLLGGPVITGSTWELIGPSGLACDLGGGRVHGCVVNLIGPTLHSMRHSKPEESASAASVAAANTSTPSNSVGIGYLHSSMLSSHEKNIQAQIDIIHK